MGFQRIGPTSGWWLVFIFARQRFRDVLKQVLDLIADFRARFGPVYVDALVLLLLLFLYVSLCDFSLLVQVGLVAHDEYERIITPLAPDVFYPFSCLDQC